MSNDNTQPSRNETTTTAASGTQVREGVLAVPGELKLHFGGTLESVSIAWRSAASRHRAASGCPTSRAAAGGTKWWVPASRSTRSAFAF